MRNRTIEATVLFELIFDTVFPHWVRKFAAGLSDGIVRVGAERARADAMLSKVNTVHACWDG
jgi:hypothetical protein